MGSLIYILNTQKKKIKEYINKNFFFSNEFYCNFFLSFSLSKITKTQDRLIDGYQRENERLTKELQNAQKETAEMKKKLFVENERLGLKVNTLQSQLGISDKQDKALNLRQQLAQDAALVELREELERVKSEHHTREMELRNEIENLRKAKRVTNC